MGNEQIVPAGLVPWGLACLAFGTIAGRSAADGAPLLFDDRPDRPACGWSAPC